MRVRHAGRERAELLREARLKLQVREFSGSLYLSYMDVPLMKESDLSGKLTEALSSSRENYMEYVRSRKEEP